MDNSIYVALSRQMTLFRDLAMTSNNIANADTTGYQAEKIMFTDYLTDDGNFHKVAFAQDISSYLDTTPGRAKLTSNPLDMMVKGDGFFTVETPFGNRYTRNGSFQLDGQGFLITPEGYPVLDEGGQRIQLEPEDRDIRVLSNGGLVINGELRANLGIVEFQNRQELVRLNSTLYEGENPQPAQNTEVLHGVLEGSNVQAVTELVRLTELSRSTTNSAKFIEVMYDLQRKTSNTWTEQG